MKSRISGETIFAGRHPACLAPALAVGLALAIAGCATSPEPMTPGEILHRGEYGNVWPELPAPPRIGHLFSFSSPSDLGMKSKGWKRMFGWLTGSGTDATTFSKPFAVAFDEDGNICMTDTGTASVWFFNLEERTFSRWNTIGPHRLVSPVAIAKSDGVFYVADAALGRILAFRSDKELLREFTEEIGRPAGLAVDSGRLYVADVERHRIAIFDLDGNFIGSFGKRGRAPGEFNFPTHVTVDGSGRVLVTDAMNARIQVFEDDGRLLGTIGSLGDASGHFSRPKATAVDRSGNVYVVDALFDNLQVFDLDGRFLLNLGEAGSGPAEFWMPTGVATGADGIILVADSYNHRVQVFEYIGKDVSSP